jgi:predicted nucleic acid-binding protein
VSGWLLDTNVLSELARPEPAPAVVAFLEWAEPAFLSAVSLHELRFGVERLAAGRRQEELRCWLAELETLYAKEIIPVGVAEADEAARLRADAARRGRTIHLAEGLIAGTAIHHGLALATRDVGDLAGLPVRMVNPWAA